VIARPTLSVMMRAASATAAPASTMMSPVFATETSSPDVIACEAAL
jgi:hypothetical protein